MCVSFLPQDIAVELIILFAFRTALMRRFFIHTIAPVLVMVDSFALAEPRANRQIAQARD